jgi:hypothetical protein
VETNVKAKLQGDTLWTECPDANVSGCGLLFDTLKRLNEGDLNTLQFMLHYRSGSSDNTLFFANAKVIRAAPRKGFFRTAVEFVIDDMARSEILRVLNIIRCQELKTSNLTVLRTKGPE